MSNHDKIVLVARRFTSTLAILCAVMLMGCQSAAQAQNLALGKPVKVEPHSQYWFGDPPTPRVANSRKIWEDKDEAVLVDGIHGLGQVWVQPATPVWVHAARPQITIDLGRVHNIDRVCFYSPTSGGVQLPIMTAVRVSEDGKEYFLAGTVNAFGLKRETSYVHKFEVPFDAMRGRYVQLVLQTATGAVSVDEVEVFGSAIDGSEKAPAGPTTLEALYEMFDRVNEARWLAGEWQEMKEQIEHRFEPEAEAHEATLSEALLQQVQDVDKKLAHMDVSTDAALAAFREQYVGLRAQAARPLFGSELLYWAPDPWSDLHGSAFPTTDAEAPEAIRLSMWQNEYEHAALGIANLGDAPAHLSVQVSPLRDENGQTVAWTDRLWLRRARAVPVRSGYRVLDALPLVSAEAPDRAELVVPPGESLVLWMTFYSLDLEPGLYESLLEVLPAASRQEKLAVPVTLTVAPLRMLAGDRKTLNTYMWDYLKGWSAPPEGRADLAAHGVNTFIIHPESVPRPVFNSDRTAVLSVDCSVLDEALARTGDPRWHGVFWGEGPADKLFNLKEPSEQKLFKQWISLWAAHLETKGFGPERYFFYPYDEKIPENMVTIARLIKEVDPRLLVYSNANVIAPELMARIGPYIDIWCPYHKTFDPDTASTNHRLTDEQRAAFEDVRKKYRPLVWTYACDGPARTLSPLGYYRHLSWWAFGNNATGAGFWCYMSNNDSWDDFDGSSPEYAVVYVASDAPPDVPRTEAMISSRRWEACRDGAEDYQYLHELREAIRAAGENNEEPVLIADAQALLQECVQNVFDAAGESGRYAQARTAITEAILRLRGTAAPAD